MELAVIRHTRLDIDVGRCYGQSEVNLADSFDDELAQLRSQLTPPWCAVYSSPLQRCNHLAKQFSDSIDTDTRLLEYDFGDWEMTRWDDIDSTALNLWMQDFVNYPTPNGESLVAMYARIATFMEALRARDHQSCLIVTHAGVIRCIWAYLLQIPLEQIFKLAVGYGEVLRCSLAQNSQEDLIYSANPLSQTDF
jgi:alpha-ribazole phosphatase